MIQQTRFLGISLRTRAHRRALVMGFYALLLIFIAVPVYRHKLLPGYIMAQTFVLGSILGGLKTGGPVKFFGEEDSALNPDRGNPISLNLERTYSPFHPTRLLDEREIATRDHAHYVAYRLLLVGVASTLGLLVLTAGWTLHFAQQNAPNLLWGFLLVVMSLPQSVILWTEPDPLPEGTLALVEARR